MSLVGIGSQLSRLVGRINGVKVYHTDAYAIAVRNGFEGTEEEWLASLKGVPGESNCNCPLIVETITLGDSGESETVAVTGLSLDLTSYSAKVGGGFYINPVVTPSNATNRAVTWKSSATNIATVDNSGYVECIAEGDAVITCTTVDGGFTATCAVSVTAESGGETEVTLSSISATYSGGDVAVGTAVTALTGIVVTAHYSDGSAEAVTGYTLSGTIAEGNNTVTVSYGGKTTTFTVTGVAESTGDAKVQLSTLERAEGLMGPNGTTVALGGCYHVTVPYSDGMYISTGINSAWGRDQYPAVVVLDNGAYTLPTMTFAEAHAGSLGGKYPTQCTCTLSGYSESATVYVSMLIGTATNDAIDKKDIFYYIPGGEN